jgi:hypothetical protein
MSRDKQDVRGTHTESDVIILDYLPFIRECKKCTERHPNCYYTCPWYAKYKSRKTRKARGER